jgi:hypothetical protein
MQRAIGVFSMAAKFVKFSAGHADLLSWNNYCNIYGSYNHMIIGSGMSHITYKEIGLELGSRFNSYIPCMLHYICKLCCPSKMQCTVTPPRACMHATIEIVMLAQCISRPYA